MTEIQLFNQSDKLARIAFFSAISSLSLTTLLSFSTTLFLQYPIGFSITNGISLGLFLFAYYLAYVYKYNLQEEKDCYLTTLDQADSAIAILDKNQSIQWANAKFRAWNNKETIRGHTFLEVTANEKEASQVFKQLREGILKTGTFQSITLAGQTVKTTISKLTTQNAFVVIMTDITKLKKADEYQKWLLAMFGHDTQKYARLSLKEVNDLYKEYDKDTALKEELSKLLVYVEHSFDLSKNLADWGALVFEKGYLKITKFINFKAQIALIEKRYAIFFKHYHIDFKQSFADNLAFHADPEMLRAILRNLISNAIEAILADSNNNTQKTRSIHVSASKEAFDTKITISDTGIGIPPTLKNSLFNLDNPTAQSSLGSLLCAYFVKAHSGKIYIAAPETPYTTSIVFIIPSKRKQLIYEQKH